MLLQPRFLVLSVFCAALALSSCKAGSGCPSNGKNVGAERLMSGEKLPKTKKFKA